MKNPSAARAASFASAADALRDKIRACAARAFAAQQGRAGAEKSGLEGLPGKGAQGLRGRRESRLDTRLAG